ncbi:hypothetical protein [Streptomyces flavidovirens]|uniref:hypothetical protein n=1 Tax=Streptomyces flavidovirens TaxID=67298 RepID=UPI00040024C5|nr:hypothetical protein [Streptomyces flavidovirens]
MPRIALTVGSLVAAGMLVFAVPGSAVAADGMLIINDTAYEWPSGCYDSDRRPLSVSNHTDTVAYMYSGSACSGEVTEVILPAESTVSEFGNSVLIA